MAKRLTTVRDRNNNTWIYKNKVLNEIPVDMKYFVYQITEISTGKFYIGYKGFYTNRKKKLLKSEISTDKRKSKFRIETKESNWKEYNSSSKTLSELVLKNPTDFYKEIFIFCETEKKTKYMEQKWQYKLEVLEKDSFNENIAGKFFRRDLI